MPGTIFLIVRLVFCPKNRLNRLMKICYIFSNIHLSQVTAQPGIVMKLARKVAERGTHVYAISNNTQVIRTKRVGIEYFLFKGSTPFRSYMLNLLRITRYLRRIRPDIIHVHGNLIIIPFWIISRLLGIPCVCSLCEILDRNVVSTLQKKTILGCLSRSKKTIVTSTYLKKMLVDNDVPASNIHVARIGVDERFFVHDDSARSKADVLFYGDANKERGFDLVMMLARELPHLQFLVLLRSKKRHCWHEPETVNKTANVSFLDYPYAEELEKIILKCKVIVLPYRWMSVRPPLTLVEPMALGKCVVTSALEGNEEIIENAVNALIADFTQIKEVAQLIQYLVNDDRRRNAIGVQAQKTVRELYSVKEYDKVFTLYQGIVDHQKQSPEV